MENTIELFDPNDKPFGRLSNNSYHPMTIDGKKYDTVTNYIYSNMLTSPTLRNIVQNAKIHDTKGVNKELMTAIDFLMESRPKLSTTLSEQRVSDDRMVQVIVDNTDYSVQVVKSWPKHKQWEEYQKVLKNAELMSGGFGEEKMKDIWAEFAKASVERGDEKSIQKQREYQMMISNIVKKPFESIDLAKLKQQLIAESARNRIGIYQLYNKNRDLELFNIVSDATHKGYETRFQDPKLKDILLGTGNFPIQYESTDPFLGIGVDGNGANLVGKVLMQMRHNLRVKSHETEIEERLQSKYKKIYNTYIAYVILRKEIIDNKKQLTEYRGLSPSQIIAKYGVKNLLDGIPSQETVIQLYKRDQIPDVVMTEIFNPGTLYLNVRRLWLSQLRNQLLRDKDDIILNSYLEYMLRYFDEGVDKEVDKYMIKEKKLGKRKRKARRSEVRNEIIEYIIARLKSTLTHEQISKMKSRVVDLFKLGMLSASLSDKIDEDIATLQIPSEEDVREAEIATILPEPVVEEIHRKSSDDSSISSTASTSSTSSNGTPITKMMKKIFKEDDRNRKEMIDSIVAIKGGNSSKYKDWSTTEIKQRLEALETEEWGKTKKETKTGVHESKDINEPFVIDKDTVYVQPSGDPIRIFKDVEQNPPELALFNPESYTGMLIIDNMYYPTIQHYIISKLIANTGTKRVVDSYGSVSFKKGMGTSDAHMLILVDPNNNGDKPEDYLTIPLTGEVYDKVDNETTTLLLSIYTVTSLNKKFSDKGLQDLLLLTGDAQINWNSPENFYLGSGNEDNPGYNYVGATMMEIREKIKESRVLSEEVSVDTSDIVRFIQKDAFIKSWVEMRVSDMCGVVYRLQQYLKIKDGIEIDLNEEERLIQIVKYVLDTVYQPCSALVDLSKEIKMDVPDFFVRMVSKCKGMVSGVPPMTITDNLGNVRYNNEIEERKKQNASEINRLETEFWGGTRIDHTLSESKEFEDYQRVEWAKFWDELNHSEASEKDKKEALENFKNFQKNEYNDFWGIDTTKKTNEEILRHDHEISELKKEFSAYLRKQQNIDHHYNLVKKEIAQVYWDRIAVMLSTLILNVNPSTGTNIRDVIVKAEMMISENMNCVRIIANEQDNCIVSAILNLLVGIMKFKEEFSDNMVLDEDDVRLAGSIILNNKFAPKIATNDDGDESDESDDEDDEDIKSDSQRDVEDVSFDVSSAGLFPQDIIEGSDDDEENPYFSFDQGVKGGKRGKGDESHQIGSSGDLAKIEQQVIQISPENSKEIALEIMKTVQIIKNSNISTKVKQNRINFFATIR